MDFSLKFYFLFNNALIPALTSFAASSQVALVELIVTDDPITFTVAVTVQLGKLFDTGTAAIDENDEMIVIRRVTKMKLRVFISK
ncbi:MAG: hypothetical protein KatS3mg032_2285 [Cyclobacteriaceae bacterium]|nr:MAG: hypothetical protein KatS3mg032_2285 [Cyclobacteriaceae bacterium]